MGKKTRSTTKKESSLFGGHHYRTVITDGVNREERLGKDARESQQRASKDKKDKTWKWG